MPVRIKDLAQILNLDSSTVSRSLRGDARVRASTAQRVRELAGKLGYHPNLGARSLAGGGNKTIWFLLPELVRGLGLSRAVEAGGRFLLDRGYDLLVALHLSRSDAYERLVGRLIRGDAEGVLIVPTYFGRERAEIEKLLAEKHPVVFMDRWLEDLDVPVFTTDNAACSANLVRLCHEAGAEFFFLLFGGRGDNMVERARQRGALEELARRRLPFALVGSEFHVEDLPSLPGKMAILDSKDAAIQNLAGRLLGFLEGRSLCYGVFDEWNGNPSPAQEVFICVQDVETLTRLALECLLRMLESGESPRGEITRVPALKYTVIRGAFTEGEIPDVWDEQGAMSRGGRDG